MKKSKTFSRILAIVCSVALVVGGVYVYPNETAGAVKAADDASHPISKAYQVVGVEDFIGADEYEVPSGTKQTKSASDASVKDTIIDGMYHLSGYPSIQIGQYNGVRFQMQINGRKELVYLFANGATVLNSGSCNSGTAGCTYLNEDVRIKVGFTFSEEDATAGTAKVTVRISVGDTYSDVFTTPSAVPTKNLVQTMHLTTDANSTIGIKKYVDDTEYLELGIEAFTGVKTKTATEQTPLMAKTGTLKNVIIDGIYQLKGYPSVNIGGQWTGLQFQGRGTDSLKYQYVGSGYTKTISSKEAGSVVTGEDIRIKTGFKFENEDTVAGTADVTVTMIVGEYEDVFVIPGAKVSDLAKTVSFYATGSTIEDTVIATAVEKEINYKLLDVTYQDYGWADGKYEALSNPVTRALLNSTPVTKTETATALSLNGKVFTADFTFVGDGTTLYFAKTADVWQGLRFAKSGGNFSMATSYGGFSAVTMTPADAGLTAQQDGSYKFNLKLSFEYVDYERDGKTDDVKLGVWFNDKLFNESYIYSLNDANKYGTGIGFYNTVTGSSITYSSPVRSIPTNNTPYVLEDFGVEEKNYTGQYVRKNIEPMEGSTSISGKIELTEGDTIVLYGGPDANEEWLGPKLYARSGNIQVQFPGIETWTVLYPSNAKAGKTFAFTIAADKADLDNDGAVDDVRYGFWFDGTMLTNKYYYYLNYASEVSLTVAINPYAGISPVEIPVTATVDTEYVLANVGHKVSGKGYITVNNEKVDDNTVITTPNDYFVRCANQGSYVKFISIYTPGDVRLDGAVSAVDLVALKRAVQMNETFTTKAAKKAADADESGAINMDDCEMVRVFLVR